MKLLLGSGPVASRGAIDQNPVVGEIPEFAPAMGVAASRQVRMFHLSQPTRLSERTLLKTVGTIRGSNDPKISAHERLLLGRRHSDDGHGLPHWTGQKPHTVGERHLNVLVRISRRPLRGDRWVYSTEITEVHDAFGSRNGHRERLSQIAAGLFRPPVRDVSVSP